MKTGYSLFGVVVVIADDRCELLGVVTSGDRVIS